jgi:hypothetical protein
MHLAEFWQSAPEARHICRIEIKNGSSSVGAKSAAEDAGSYGALVLGGAGAKKMSRLRRWTRRVSLRQS